MIKGKCPGFSHVFSPPLFSGHGHCWSGAEGRSLCPDVTRCLAQGHGCDHVTEQLLPPLLPDAQGREGGHHLSGRSPGAHSYWLWLVKGCRVSIHGNPG